VQTTAFFIFQPILKHQSLIGRYSTFNISKIFKLFLALFKNPATITFMELIKGMIDFIVHIDHHMATIAASYGSWTYLILFGIIFAETGLVITPFLPGDSLLFVLGALTTRGSLNIAGLWVLLTAAAIAGDAVNYYVGSLFKEKVLTNQKIPFIKTKHLEQTRAFYAKYGNKTIILARFVPIVRTFAPFLAGVGNMSYLRFATYNVIGAVLWVSIGLSAGCFFGNMPWVQKNFSLVILIIVILSILPAAFEFLRHRAQKS